MSMKLLISKTRDPWVAHLSTLNQINQPRITILDILNEGSFF